MTQVYFWANYGEILTKNIEFWVFNDFFASETISLIKDCLEWLVLALHLAQYGDDIVGEMLIFLKFNLGN